MNHAARKEIYLFATLALLVAWIAVPVSGAPVSPWADANQPNQTRYWGYDFDDNVLFPPTVTAEDGNWDPGSDPVWSISGSGDIVSISDGRLGIHAPGQPSSVHFRLDVPNEPNPSDIKYFWFSYDWYSDRDAPLNDAGTDIPGHVVSPITYTENTGGNHVEGYVTIDPQPQEEWVSIRLTAGIGETAWIDNLQVGSVCIPEPSVIILIGFGGIAGVFIRKRVLPY